MAQVAAGSQVKSTFVAKRHSQTLRCSRRQIVRSVDFHSSPAARPEFAFEGDRETTHQPGESANPDDFIPTISMQDRGEDTLISIRYPEHTGRWISILFELRLLPVPNPGQ